MGAIATVTVERDGKRVNINTSDLNEWEDRGFFVVDGTQPARLSEADDPDEDDDSQPGEEEEEEEEEEEVAE